MSPALTARRTLQAGMPFALIGVAAAYFVVVELHRAAVVPLFDIYIYFVPNKLHAVQSVWQGGKGLLWNPYQACGEPFFANPAMGLLYPPHLLFLALDPNTAVQAVLILNMALGASGMLLLGRELGLGSIAALGGAVAFELGPAMIQLTGWSPMHSGPWTWLPWALFCCERVLRAPSRPRIIALAAVVALGALPGWVILSALTCQLVALRVGWELLTRRGARPWRAAGGVAIGLVLAALLISVQLLPAAELARESQRLAVDAGELAYGALTVDFGAAIRGRIPPVPFVVVLLLLAAVAPMAGAHRRLVVFYLAVGTVYGVLALGPVTPLYDLYVKLPPGGATLRYPHRLFWITDFSLAMLVALCLEGFTASGGRSSRRWLASTVATMVAMGLYGFTPGGLRGIEVIALAGVLAGAVAASAHGRLAQPAAAVVIAALALDLLGVPIRYEGRLLPSADGLWRHAGAFAALRAGMTPQDRLYLSPSISSMFNLGLITKTATIMRTPDIYDYEPLLGYRLVDYVGTMWGGQPVRSVEAATTFPTVVAGYRRRLLDLASVRYIVAPRGSPLTERGLDLPRLADEDPSLILYSNETAFPRARWMPRIEVVPDPDAILYRLAYGADDLARVALVEASPPSGFMGGDAPAGSGSVRWVRDDPEHLVIEVDAPARGFLLVADQNAPGWRATVDGVSASILRANYTFRLVEVPAGTSRVELRYRPTSVVVGAAISALTAAILVVVLLRGRQHHA